MTTSYLLHNKFKNVGWITLSAGIVLFFLLVICIAFFAPWKEILQISPGQSSMSNAGKTFFINTPIWLSTLGILLIGGMLVIALSQEKTEDEFIKKLRKSAFLHAVLYNYILLMLLYFWLPEPGFLKFFGFSIFNVLLMYIFDFHIRLNYQDLIDDLENKFKRLGDAK